MNSNLNFTHHFLKTFLILICIVFFLIQIGTPFGAYGEVSDFEFARYLYRKGFYREAASEILKYIYFTKEDEKKIYPAILLALCYIKMKDFSDAINVLDQVKEKLEQQEVGRVIGHLDADAICEVYYQILYALFLEKNLEEYRVVKDQFYSRGLSCEDKVMLYVERMELALLIYNLKWVEALSKLNNFPLSEDSAGKLVKQKIIEGENDRNKSPILGGILNLIPGLGYIYAGRFAEAGRSFVINSTIFTFSAYSFSKKSIGFGIAFSVIGLITYTANIYGGVNATLQKNAIDELNRSKEILELIPIPRPAPILLRDEILGR